MSMSVGGGSSLKSEINVTPLVDVVLVLLIIFMVVIPILQMGYPIDTPPESKVAVVIPNADQLIVRMDRDGKAYLNKEEVPMAQFASRLKQVTTNRGSKIVFFAADGELPYGQVADFMDLCRNNGAKNLGIVFDDIKPAGT
jgi:biopolymer transport protein TolR